MGNLADGKRTGYGITGLWRRYVRRAEFLTQDPEFRNVTRQYRGEWIRSFPEYPLTPGVLTAGLGTPEGVNRDVQSLKRRKELLQTELERLMELGKSTEDTFKQWRDSYIGPPQAPAGLWEWLHLQLNRRFFHWEDFPYPYSERLPPATPFLAASLHGDPLLLFGECDKLIPKLVLQPYRTMRYDVLAGADEYDPDEEFPESDPQDGSHWLWYLPLYPGITAKDIMDAAPHIAETVNGIYESRTARARIVTLRAEGLTHKQIADRLGLTEQTVAATLKNADILTTENT